MATLLIAADICPIEGNRPSFVSGDADALLHDLLPEFEQADLCIANLECPLIDHPSPIPKTGPTFGEPSSCIKGIKALGIDVLGLANNHILDHGALGLENTLKVCAQAGIDTVGAGPDLQAAGRLMIRKVGKVRLAVLAVAEHEFSIASRISPGANPLDLIRFVREVTTCRDQFDYLLVLFHGGDEFLVPSPRVQETCRFMIEMGANAVIVQHPHVLGGYENYRHGHIVYGQGALLMDEAIYRSSRSFHEGFLIKLVLGGDAKSTMTLVPFVQSNPVPGARRLGHTAEQEFLRNLAERSTAIQDDAFVRSEWVKFCRKHKHSYLSGLLGHNRVLHKLNAQGWILRSVYNRRALLGVRNIVCCETHREAIETIFNQSL